MQLIIEKPQNASVEGANWRLKLGHLPKNNNNNNNSLDECPLKENVTLSMIRYFSVLNIDTTGTTIRAAGSYRK